MLSRGTDGRFTVSPVVRVESFPPGAHPEGACIVKEMTAVKISCANGGVRWYGCSRARITSALRMALEGMNERDEVVRRWEDEDEERTPPMHKDHDTRACGPWCQ